jgi:fatty-acyl-CoA synthase
MLPPPPDYSNRADIAKFAAVRLEDRLAGRDLVTIIRDAAVMSEDRPALSYRPSGKADGAVRDFTRRELIGGAANFATNLTDLGIGRRDVVASLLPNGPGTIAAAMGVLSTAVLAPINIFLETGQIHKLLKASAARAILVPRVAPPALEKTFAALRQMQENDALRLIEVDTEEITQSTTDDRALAPRPLGELAAVFHTGGTTGLPKLVPLSAGHLSAMALISQFAYGYREDDLILCAMPMFHVGGLFACSLFPLACGSRVSVLGALGYRGEGVIATLPETIATLGISVAIGPPTVMSQLAERPPDMKRASRLRLFISGAAALPRTVGTKLSTATGIPVVEPWGLTESTLAVACGPRNGPLKQGSVGLALPYCDVKAVRTDATGDVAGTCAIDEIGLLAINGATVFDGYIDRAAQDQPFLADGWLDSGDLGRIDADGFIWVTGRAKELIKRGGHGIDPGLIEDVLHAHPDVALAAAIGKPDPYAGELPIAYVQAKSGTAIDLDALIAFARERIAERAAVPKEIIVLDRLPLTAIGKVHKQSLRLDITRRVAEDTVRQLADGGAEAETRVEPHALHGLIVRVRAPARYADAIREKLAAYTFRSETTAIEGDR